MPYIGSAPAATALTSADIADGAVTTAKINDDAVTTAKINNDSVTLAKMASGTDGNIITYDASGDPAAVSTGSSGQVLTSAGAGSPPTFAAAAEAGWTFVEKVTASGDSTVDIGDSTNVVAGFDYIIRCDDMDTSADQQASGFGLRFGTGSGTPTYQNSSYNSQEHQTVATSNVVSNVAGASELRFALTNINIGGAGAGETQTIEIVIYNPNANQKTRASMLIFGDNSGNVMYNTTSTGERDVSEVVTSFQIVLASGTVSGNFILCKRAIA